MIKFLHFFSIFRPAYSCTFPQYYGLALVQIPFQKRQYFGRYQGGGGKMSPPPDVSPTEKHADVTRVKWMVFGNGNLEGFS